MFRRVLVANRGEIALRVIRACRALNVQSIAVYSDADAESPHVAAADTAVRIGPAPAADSYLSISSILDAARKTSAEAIHPGYGFLSENPAFADACEAHGVRFVGPPSTVISRMGSKTDALETARRAGVPVVPGTVPASQTLDGITDAVRTTGLPALLKASAGGGGKGMRLIQDAKDIGDSIAQARREAERAFGDGTLYVERVVAPARHIEVQIVADGAGGIVHLFERDCSLQRRHQKVIEQAPAPDLSPSIRERITRAAVGAARSAGYVNAGTIEFLVHGEGDEAQFYFLEMNTRLQVEHPVTEAVTGVDIVQLQLRIAAGEPLPFRQDDIHLNGFACECRVYAEDSERLLPQTGTLLRYREPGTTRVRVDSGVREGLRVTQHYDPLIAKVIAHATSRTPAIETMTGALREFEILGLRHNIPFLLALLARDEVRHGQPWPDTTFIDRHLSELARPVPRDIARAAAALAAFVSTRPHAPAQPAEDLRRYDPWDTLGRLDW
jgi:acetyl-CoA/propionyl-CoA carboxylase biotin carboxyl carrier protein